MEGGTTNIPRTFVNKDPESSSTVDGRFCCSVIHKYTLASRITRALTKEDITGGPGQSNDVIKYMRS